VGAALLGSCKPGVVPQNRPKPAARDEIAAMLAGRAAKLAAGDADGYLAAMDPAARELEQPIAAGASSVPLTGFQFVIRDTIPNQATIPPVRVDLEYEYKGLPADNVFGIQLVYAFGKSRGVRGEVAAPRAEQLHTLEAAIPPRSEEWKITSASLASGEVLPVWATGAVGAARSAHFLALFRPGANSPDATLALAERAREALAPKLTFPLEPAFLTIFARNEAEYTAISSRGAPASAIAQAETTFSLTHSKISVRNRLILVNLEEMSSEPAAVETFQHELAHLALAPDTRPFTPSWVTEGSAMYLAGTRPVDAWRSGVHKGSFDLVTLDSLTTSAALGAHDPTGKAASVEYAYSAAAAGYLIETFGQEKFWSFYRFYAGIPPAYVYDKIPGGSESEVALTALAREVTQKALTASFALDSAALDLRVREWIERQAG
jgi:hypothetical protein